MNDQNLQSINVKHVSLTHKRIFAIAMVIVVALVVATISTVAVGASKDVKNIRASALEYGVSPNPEPNPGLTAVCPAPTFNIMLLVDRSYSVINDGGGNANVISMKEQVQAFLDIISDRTQTYGGVANVSINAFGSLSVLQDGPAWRSDWQSKLNIADNANLALKNQLVDNIWFAGNNPPTDPATPYLGHGTYTPALGYLPTGLSFTGNLGHTNQHSAFIEASKFIDSRTPNTNNPSAVGPNDDYDMVIVLTDGYPNRTSGLDAVANGTGDDQYSGANPNTIVLQQTQDAVVKLRRGEVQTGATGTNVYPKTNVYGMLVGSTDATNRTEIMNAVFGQNVAGQFPKWSSVSGFGTAIGDELSSVMDKISCSSPTTEVNTGISVTPDVSEINIFEGEDASLKFTVKNTSSNEVSLRDVKYSINSTLYDNKITCASGTDGDILTVPGTSTVQCTMTVARGTFNSAGNFPQQINVRGTANFDTTLYSLATGASATPTGSATVTIRVTPAKYPS